MSAPARTPYQDTGISVEKSMQEVRKMLRAAGARGVQIEDTWEPPKILIRFLWPVGEGFEQIIRVRLEAKPLPPEQGARGGWRVSPEQRERQVWRALAWYLKTMLASASAAHPTSRRREMLTDRLKALGIECPEVGYWPLAKDSVQFDLPPFSGEDARRLMDAADAALDALVTVVERLAEEQQETKWMLCHLGDPIPDGPLVEILAARWQSREEASDG